jgi:hypothetical protein
MAGAIQLAILAAALGAALAACGPAARRHADTAKQPPLAAAPPACFASNGCPGMHATICFAATGSRTTNAHCPTLRRQFRFAEPPPRRR